MSRRARSRSKPVDIDKDAASSSEVLMDLSVWGMVRAASAITAASRASVGSALPTPDTDEDLDIVNLRVRLPCLVSTGPALGRLIPHPRLRKDSKAKLLGPFP